MTTLLYKHPSCLEHDTGYGHPECAERLTAILTALETAPFAALEHRDAPQATTKQLARIHSTDHIERTFAGIPRRGYYAIDGDTTISPQSGEAALRAAGAACAAVDAVLRGEADNAFCAIRPPGHHAEPNTPYGFCFFNNCVIAARYWQSDYGRKRVCIVDFDAHHGNGIQTAFEEEADTAYISIHEHPSFSYPGTGWPEETGIKDGRGTILNLPLLPGSTDVEVRALFPAIRKFAGDFQAEAFVIGAGFDGHAADDMSGLNYSFQIFKELGSFLAGLAWEQAQGRMLSILEGGYCLECLGESVAAYLQGIQEFKGDIR